MRYAAIAALAALLAACGDQPFHYDYEIHQGAGVPEYGIIQREGPVVVVLAGEMDETLVGPDVGKVSQQLANAKFTVVSMDLPSHHAGDDPLGISGWRKRIDAGDTTLFSSFCADLSRVLDDLGVTQVNAVGISRGGYVVSTCAAYDSRIENIALLAPVTDLARLEEFHGCALDENLFGLTQYVPMLSRRHVLVRIGKNDQRVGTDAAVAFAKSIGATLKVVNADGHTYAEDGSTIAWLYMQPGNRR